MTNIKITESKIWHSYHVHGQAHHHTLKKNAIFVANNITVKHELAKSVGAIMLKRYGDLKFTKKIIDLIRNIDYEIAQLNLVENPSNFITEACPNLEPNRRIDLVDIKSDTRFEFETNPKISKGKDCITIYI